MVDRGNSTRDGVGAMDSSDSFSKAYSHRFNLSIGDGNFSLSPSVSWGKRNRIGEKSESRQEIANLRLKKRLPYELKLMNNFAPVAEMPFDVRKFAMAAASGVSPSARPSQN